MKIPQALVEMGSAALAAAAALPRSGDPNLQQGINGVLKKEKKSVSVNSIFNDFFKVWHSFSGNHRSSACQPEQFSLPTRNASGMEYKCVFIKGTVWSEINVGHLGWKEIDCTWPLTQHVGPVDGGHFCTGVSLLLHYMDLWGPQNQHLKLVLQYWHGNRFWF